MPHEVYALIIKYLVFDSMEDLAVAMAKRDLPLTWCIMIAGVGHRASVVKSLPILACQAWTSTKMQWLRKWEQALNAAENTCQLEDLLRLSKGMVHAPTNNIWELKLNIVTFMAIE
jgi:hypothetical protein